MAKEDYKTPDVQDQADFVADVSAHQSDLDRESKKAAQEAGVVDAVFVDYPEAIARYEGRADVETLEQRRARESGTSFRDADNLRALGEVDGVLTTRAVQEHEDSQVTPSPSKDEVDSKSKTSKK